MKSKELLDEAINLAKQEDVLNNEVVILLLQSRTELLKEAEGIVDEYKGCFKHNDSRIFIKSKLKELE